MIRLIVVVWVVFVALALSPATLAGGIGVEDSCACGSSPIVRVPLANGGHLCVNSVTGYAWYC